MSSYQGKLETIGIRASRAHVHGLSAAMCLLMTAGACGTWRQSSRKVVGTTQHVRGGGVADGSLHSDGHVTRRGDVRFALSMRGQCYNNVETRQRVRIREYKKGSGSVGLGATIAVVGVIGVAVGLPVTLSVDSSYMWLPISGGVLYVAGLMQIIKGKKGGRNSYRTRHTSRSLGRQRVPAACSPKLARKAQRRMPKEFVLTTPWGQTVSGRRRDASVDFAVDWSRAGINPLQPAYEKLRAGWQLADRNRQYPMAWAPNQSDLTAMVRVAGLASGTDITVRAGGAPPMVVVQRFSAKPPLAAGRTSTLTLTLANQGSGDAYRFSARTKSSHSNLHGVQFPFGRIRAGAKVIRRAQVTLPRGDRGGDALVLLDFAEANRNAPERYSQSFAIGAAKRPRLVAKCSFVRGVNTSDPRRMVADAGKQLLLQCQVTNRGVGRAAGARVTASIANQRAKVSQIKNIAPGRKGTFDVLLRVPQNARLSQAMPVRIEISETSYNVKTNQYYTVYVGKPSICSGTITRAKFNRKMGILRQQLNARDITRKQFKDYEAQLVGCLP